MKKKQLIKYFLFASTLCSCAAVNKTFDKREFRKSKVIATYTGMANELQDGYLVLKENGYFKFYQKLWLIVTIKQGENFGRYSQSNDTLYLNWLDINPKEIKYYLSSKCVIDPTTKNLWFIDEITNQRLWGLGRKREN
ncbi:MAG: hypothetical protein IPP72_16280 [Chitinophagaceae bacterium]|nr:hypothetical protein [Chitinophagaceae bacterium]